VFCLELKRDGGRMSDAQIAMHSHLMACGCGYLCTNSYDEALATLKSHGIVRATVSA
jgi:Leu/Phe-tRNA-protein transferase